ncbi:hypothetical protein BCR34DRAFT_573532 [Clohesyomyces aquaticus]|uniref:Uncharacterized protein n=1 Tax=Clohesyomyces aquaticus TaxID=1231657 RepID=A0A1Y1Z0E3_9PLEO|nr:hypothetical protein BCR34DRAFT_573532 [Clohesyomyces aquaticus]
MAQSFRICAVISIPSPGSLASRSCFQEDTKWNMLNLAVKVEKVPPSIITNIPFKLAFQTPATQGHDTNAP